MISIRGKELDSLKRNEEEKKNKNKPKQKDTEKNYPSIFLSFLDKQTNK
jgi:hypothetical protein